MPVSPEVLADLAELGYDLDDVREGNVLVCVMRVCPQCGTTVACKWTPDGTEPLEGCDGHQ